MEEVSTERCGDSSAAAEAELELWSQSPSPDIAGSHVLTRRWDVGSTSPIHLPPTCPGRRQRASQRVQNEIRSPWCHRSVVCCYVMMLLRLKLVHGCSQ